jgi:ketosteroid isomerase-like protein
MKPVTWDELMSGTAAGFKRGDELWSNDGETWHRGKPPKREPMSGGLRIVRADYARGEIAVMIDRKVRRKISP